MVLNWKFTASFLDNTFVVLIIFLIEFRNKWYLIWKPWHRAFRIRKKNWRWYHPEDGQAPLTKKALLSVELVWSLSRQRLFQFQYCFQTARYRAFFWGIKLFPTSTGFEIASCWIWKSRKSAWKRCILLHKSSYFRLFFWTSRFNSSPFWSQLR